MGNEKVIDSAVQAYSVTAANIRGEESKKVKQDSPEKKVKRNETNLADSELFDNKE